MDGQWGYLAESGDSSKNVTPLVIGEFGTNAWSAPGKPVAILPGSLQNNWFLSTVVYLAQRSPIGWAYWALNGTQADGAPFNVDPKTMQQTRKFGAQEIYGILDTGWGKAPPSPTDNLTLLFWLITAGV